MQKPIWFEGLYRLGLQYNEQGAFDNAARCLRAACVADPNHAAAWCEQAYASMKTGDLPSALRSIRKAIDINPNSPRNFTIAAMIASDFSRFEDALRWIGQAQRLEPDNPGIDLVKADILCLSGDYCQAEQALQTAADKGMELTEIELHRCELLRLRHRFAELNTALTQLLEDTSEPRIQLMLGELQLAEKNYADGWRNYQARLRMEEQPIIRNYPWAYWQGESLEGKTILVHGEQGVGDEIMFSSCLPDLVKSAGKVIVVLQERLSELLTHSFPDISAVSESEVQQTALRAPQSIDYCVAVGSLPLHFRRELTDFPDHTGYLRADKNRILPWQEKLQTLGNGLRIGISWQGGVMRTGLLNRSLQLEQLLPLLELPGIQFINIQHGKVRRELEWLAEMRNLPATTWPLDTKNISELAGLVSALDLIITPCCSLVHLAGALGKPVWVMTPKVAAWRYLNEGETMPWYPSARLFRQPEIGDWASVIEAIRQQLLEKQLTLISNR